MFSCTNHRTKQRRKSPLACEEMLEGDLCFAVWAAEMDLLIWQPPHLRESNDDWFTFLKRLCFVRPILDSQQN
jgi:hypothetical protein